MNLCVIDDAITVEGVRLCRAGGLGRGGSLPSVVQPARPLEDGVLAAEGAW